VNYEHLRYHIYIIRQTDLSTKLWKTYVYQPYFLGGLDEVVSLRKIAKFFLLSMFLAKYKSSVSFLLSTLKWRFCLYMLIIWLLYIPFFLMFFPSWFHSSASSPIWVVSATNFEKDQMRYKSVLVGNDAFSKVKTCQE